MSDYITELRRDLVEAAARQQAAGRRARVARPLLPRAWSPPAVLGAMLAAAALVAVVLGLRAVSPPRPPEAPKVTGTQHIGTQPRDAAAADGGVVIADFDGRVLRLTPGSGVVKLADAGAAPVSVAAAGTSVWLTSLAPPQRRPHSTLMQLDARSGSRLSECPILAEGDSIAVGAGGIWLRTTFTPRHIHGGGSLERIDPHTGRRTALIPDEAQDLAVSDHTVWTRDDETVTQRDESGRVVNRVRGISPVLGLEGQRTMIADADGAWVVGQSDGLLYRIEKGAVAARLRIGELGGAIARSDSAVWVTAMVGTRRFALVRIDPDTATVTGRVPVGSDEPQTIVPIGDQVWVVTALGAIIKVSQG